MKKHIVKIPKVGTCVDNGVYDSYVDRRKQDLLIERAKQSWKNLICCPKNLVKEIKYDENQHPYLYYYLKENPYYGCKENQLKIVIE